MDHDLRIGDRDFASPRTNSDLLRVELHTKSGDNTKGLIYSEKTLPDRALAEKCWGVGGRYVSSNNAFKSATAPL